MEFDQGKFQIKPGSMMIIRPGVWHRYQPDKKTGWQENYIGIDGLIAKSLLGQSIFSTKQPVIQCGYREEFIDTYFSRFFKNKVGINPSELKQVASRKN